MPLPRGMINWEQLLRGWRELHQGLWFHAESPNGFTCSWCFWGKQNPPGLLHLVLALLSNHHHAQNHGSRGREALLVRMWCLSVNTILARGFVEACRGRMESQRDWAHFFFLLQVCVCKYLRQGRSWVEIAPSTHISLTPTVMETPRGHPGQWFQKQPLSPDLNLSALSEMGQIGAIRGSLKIKKRIELCDLSALPVSTQGALSVPTVSGLACVKGRSVWAGAGHKEHLHRFAQGPTC